MNDITCHKCNGKRLNESALSVRVGGLNVFELTDKPIDEIYKFVNEVKFESKEETEISKMIIKEISTRLKFLMDVGLNYLSLSRMAMTLSGGESQRIRLASQLGSNLTGVLYVLDEPSIGLHQKDNDKLIETLKSIRDLGNTVIVVEHDEETMTQSDYIIDIGPGAGNNGGEVVFKGTPLEILDDKKSLTGQYLSGKKVIDVPKQRRPLTGNTIVVDGAEANNLKNIRVAFPLGQFIAVTGVSGSGKSTLVNEILYKGIRKHLNPLLNIEVGKHNKIEGLENVDKVIRVSQSAIGRTPRSNPATYTGLFDDIRDIFTATIESKERGYAKGRFSFNVKGGRCEKCEGDGTLKIQMNFMADVYVKCSECEGKRYNDETLEIKYKGKTISDILEMTFDEAAEFFKNIPKLRVKIQNLLDVGLGYIQLGHSAVILSGGEAQRVKLATHLQKRPTGKSVYILDEPTTGLHTDDIKRLNKVLSKIVDNGDTVIVIEHNLDMIKIADYVIDLGPDGGKYGGEVITQGTPEKVSQSKTSHTAKYLNKILKK
jgi:excinuclease ABC subunit A